MKISKLITVLLIYVFFYACVKSQVGDRHGGISIQIRGSDTIVNLIQEWVEKFVEQNPSFNISVTGGGSGTGFASLINGTCDIAMSSRRIEEKEKMLAESKNINPVEFKIGLDGLAILVNKNNPVNKLTLEQLRDIFMARITNWKEVGGRNRKIVILSRESNSGTYMFFKERVLGIGDENNKNEFSTQSLMMSSSQTICNEVCQNPNALGYVGMGFVDERVKPVSVAVNAESEYVYPMPKNVMNGTYPISRPLYIYTNGESQDVVKMFIDYALSAAGQKIVLEADFIPIRKQSVK
ncbi:phosphate ABC transporter substrate-binding protein [Endomicrobiia bacterium]|nr:phosphate ABC transporter substrate-binding protein [Endomicrobiia bacterium]